MLRLKVNSKIIPRHASRVMIFMLVLTVLSFTAIAQSERNLIRQGDALYDKGKFKDAEMSYRKALEAKKLHPGTVQPGRCRLSAAEF